MRCSSKWLTFSKQTNSFCFNNIIIVHSKINDHKLTVGRPIYKHRKYFSLTFLCSPHTYQTTFKYYFIDIGIKYFSFEYLK